MILIYKKRRENFFNNNKNNAERRSFVRSFINQNKKMSTAVPIDDPPEKKKSALNIIKNWFLQSPSHGIRRINRAESLSARIFWSIIFLIFTTLMGTFIYTTIQKFITNPTKINLSVRQDQQSRHYPAVTFCRSFVFVISLRFQLVFHLGNLNPLRNDKFLDDFQPTQNGNDTDRRNRYTNYIASMLRENSLTHRMNSFESGYELNDLLIECTFNGRYCHRNFTPFFHPNYGNCYTFNNDENVEESRTTSLTHFWSIDDTDATDGYKLFLELYLFQDEYLSYLDDRTAFRLFLHRKHEIPILSQTTLLIAPTVFTKLIFSHRQISFSQQCRNDLTDDMKTIFGENQGRYSQALCYTLCQFQHVQKRCSCSDQLSIVYFQFFRRNQTFPSAFNRSCSPDDPCSTNQKPFSTIKKILKVFLFFFV